MQRFFSKKNIKSIGIEIFGCMLAAIGIYNFAVAAEFPMSGITGISILINHFTGLPIGVGVFLINIPMAILCYRLLGRRFFLHSLFCMVLFSVTIDYLAPLFPIFTGSRLLAALACGVLAGTGFALIFTQNASTGGTAFIIFAIKSKFPHVQLGKIVLVADLIPIVTGGIIFNDVEGVMYGLIITVLFGTMIDRRIYGANAGKLLLIVTDDSKLIRQAIEETIGRGCTIWQAQGGYDYAHREVVMCACDNTQMYRVQKAIALADQRAFTVILESSQVAGQGFERLIVGEKQGS